MNESWHESIENDEPLIHDWRARQLARLGIPRPWPKPSPTTSTGIRSPRWSAAAARPGWRCRSSCR
jgi:hypothetical protein